MFSRKPNQKDIKQRKDEVHTTSNKKIKQLDTIHFLMEHYYFPGWNVDRICTHKLLGMLAENTEEDLQPLVETYEPFSRYVYKAVEQLLLDGTYPNRKLHFDCRRLKEILKANETTVFYPKMYIAEFLYTKWITEYPNCSTVLCGKIIGMFIEANTTDDLFYIASSRKVWIESILHALSVLKPYWDQQEIDSSLSYFTSL